MKASLRKAISEGLKLAYREGRRSQTPEVAAKISSTKRANAKLPPTKRQIEGWVKTGQSLKGRQQSPESIEKRTTLTRGRLQTAILTAMGPDNVHSLKVIFRSPTNVTHRAKNVNDFVRGNPDLFNEDDVRWKPNKFNGKPWCRAASGLLTLTRKSHTRLSWKGWTLVSITEIYFDGGRDILQRNIST